MNRYVRYTITLKEPLKMGTHGSQTNTNALSYIAGSTLRGAFIKRYAECYYQNIQQLDEDTKSRSVLFKDTRFFDAYISLDKADTIPVPAVFHMNKHVLRQRDKELKEQKIIPKTYTVRTVFEQADLKYDDSMQRMDFGSFCQLQENGYNVAKVAKVANLHIRSEEKKDEEKKNGMFRYEAIAADQDFIGYIMCKDETIANNFVNAINNQIFYLGGSKGSGYGRVLIHDAETISYENIKHKLNVSTDLNENKLAIYALSHLDLFDENGNVTGEIPMPWLEKKLGISNLKLDYSSTGIIKTGGFNHTWRANLPSNSAISAGSWFFYTYEGNINQEALFTLEENGIGMRKQEGFGRILFNPKISFTINKDSKQTTRTIAEKTKKAKPDIVDQKSNNPQVAKQLELIRNSLNQQRIRDCIMDNAIRIGRQIDGKDVSKTQLSNLYAELQKILKTKKLDKEYSSEIQSYFEKLKNKQGNYRNSNTTRTFTRNVIHLDGSTKSIEQLLLDAVNNDVSLADWIQSYGQVEKNLWGGKDKNPYSNTHLKLMFISQVIYSFLRKEEKS